MTDLDEVVRSDLEALAADSAARQPGFDAIAATILGTGTPYRDDAPGAAARRRSLLEARLRELALMPVALERVFVHRVSRAAAGAVAVLGVATALAASIDPFTHRLLYMFIGQPTGALAAALLVGGVLAAYVVAGLVAERLFERRVRRGTETGPDTHADIERLAAVGAPDEARRLLDQVDAAAVALPLAGVVSGGVLLGLLVFFSDPGYSALGLVAESRTELTCAVLGAMVAGLLVGGACVRHRRLPDGSPLVRAGQHGAVLILGVVLVIATLWYASRTAFGLHAYGILPGRGTGMLLAALGVAALAVPATWAALRLRAREQRRLEL